MNIILNVNFLNMANCIMGSIIVIESLRVTVIHRLENEANQHNMQVMIYLVFPFGIILVLLVERTHFLWKQMNLLKGANPLSRWGVCPCLSKAQVALDVKRLSYLKCLHHNHR